MKFIETELAGVTIVEPDVFRDARIFSGELASGQVCGRWNRCDVRAA